MVEDYYFYPGPLLSFILAIVLSLYLFQKILFIFPKCKKNTLNHRGFTTIIAHRGSRAEGIPENSIASFRNAIKAGVTTIECDVWLTADGELVVHHDKTLTRMTGGKCTSTVESLNLNELPRLSTSLTGQSDEKHCSKYEYDEITKIPLFEDVLKLLVMNPRISMIIEFKSENDTTIEKVSNLLERYGKKGDVLWFSLKDHMNKKLRKWDPSIPTINSIVGMLKIFILYYSGILPFVDIKDSVFGITVEEISLERIRGESALAFLPDSYKIFLSKLVAGKPPFLLLAPPLFEHLRKRGIPVWFLGVNTEADMNTALSSGATAILTDRPNWACTLYSDSVMKFKRINTA